MERYVLIGDEFIIVEQVKELSRGKEGLVTRNDVEKLQWYRIEGLARLKSGAKSPEKTKLYGLLVEKLNLVIVKIPVEHSFQPAGIAQKKCRKAIVVAHASFNPKSVGFSVRGVLNREAEIYLLYR